MYLTMNRFKVVRARTEAFEELWRSRETHLDSVPGFVSFALLRGADQGDYVLYASHTIWASEQAFQDWTRSEAFRAAHKGAKSSEDLYLGPPELEVFEAVQQTAVQGQGDR